MPKLTSAGVIRLEELVQSLPAAAHAHHDGAVEEAHQTQLPFIAHLQ